MTHELLRTWKNAVVEPREGLTIKVTPYNTSFGLEVALADGSAIFALMIEINDDTKRPIGRIWTMPHAGGKPAQSIWLDTGNESDA